MVIYVDNQPISILGFVAVHDIIYEERALMLTREHDAIVTRFEIDKDYIRNLNHLGIAQGCQLFRVSANSEDLVASILADKNAKERLQLLVKEGYELSFFLCDERAKLLCDDIGYSIDNEFKFYSKCFLKSYLNTLEDECGIPIPDYLISTSAAEISEFLTSCPDGIIGKSNNGIAGEGIAQICSEEQLDTFLTAHTDNEYGLRFERYVRGIKEGSIQFIVKNGTTSFYIDECDNRNNSYNGFKYPSDLSKSKKLVAYAESITKYITQRFHLNNSYYGIDFIFDGEEFYFHDFNPRKTAVSYVLDTFLYLQKRSLLGGDVSIVNKYISINEKYYHLGYSEIIDRIKNFVPLVDSDLEGVLLVNPKRIARGQVQAISFSRHGRNDEYLERIGEELSD